MQRLGQNIGKYFGEGIDISAVLKEIESDAKRHGWTRENFPDQNELFSLHLKPTANSTKPFRLYISTGIHGDEPAGPLAVAQLMKENRWPAHVSISLCPCLNPTGFPLNTRENANGVDLNRDYRDTKTDEILAHIRWLEKQAPFDLTLCLHEDWESNGFYTYELNPDNLPSFAGKIVASVAEVCPVDLSSEIEGWAADRGVIHPPIKPQERPQWPEALYLIQNCTRQSYTLEAPSDFPLPTRVAALVAAVRGVLASL